MKTNNSMNILKRLYEVFTEKKEEKFIDFTNGFPEEQKQEIVNMALTSAAKVLMSACVLTNSHNLIEGQCVFPDGSKWTISFKKELNVVKQESK